ncbi:GNAT family N-acetyltransferase [Palleronia caenipelagi]|uniref:GNAT family N-acetyltransferase n=1 Tax=Palleronia caenipelagi TaxID=2489174 RepID=A0A547PJ26_9RHOB|nr:GNAT family N-acetyltransferase [Palleronia caenipelagi]TRD14166.1 GNAT family N-acetyltransferase [Palleronia caenipelagi]
MLLNPLRTKPHLVTYKGLPSPGTLTVWEAVYRDELGWAGDINDSFINDSFQPSSVHILAYVDGNAAGTIRIAYPFESKLPAEQKTNQPTLLHGEVSKAELTRVMVRKEFRKKVYPDYPEGLFHKLMQTAISHCRNKEITLVAMDVRVPGSSNSIFNSAVALGFRPTGITYPDPLGSDYPDCTTVILDTRSLA